MRKIHYCVAMSLDGYIAGPEGETDWVVMDPEIDFSALAGRFDTLLMGRQTFEAMSRAGHTPMPGVRVIVFSKTLQASNCPGVSITSDRAEETAVTLCGEAGKDIWLFGGGLRDSGKSFTWFMGGITINSFCGFAKTRRGKWTEPGQAASSTRSFHHL